MDLGYLDIDETTEKFGPARRWRSNGFSGRRAWSRRASRMPSHSAAIFSRCPTLHADGKNKRLRCGQPAAPAQALGYLSKVTGYYGTETVESGEKFKRNNFTGRQDGRENAGPHLLPDTPSRPP